MAAKPLCSPYNIKEIVMPQPVVQYMHLAYEDFKNLEAQCKAFNETTHRTEGGFYHKSIRLKINDGLIVEYHGPLVGGYGHKENA